jgi:hypothetical protein
MDEWYENRGGLPPSRKESTPEPVPASPPRCGGHRICLRPGGIPGRIRSTKSRTRSGMPPFPPGVPPPPAWIFPPVFFALPK